MNLLMPKKLKFHYNKEIEQYKIKFKEGLYRNSFHHLERAHILGQPYPYEHTLAHWYMLKFGFKIKSQNEIKGQIIRLLAGGIKSFIGIIPEGNTGGSDVPPLKKLPIPEELQKIIRESR